MITATSRSRKAVEIISQACRGLDYAHRNGVIHRDVKPGNLLVSEAEVVKLADFGIARAAGQSSITQVGSVLGTAAYLAPEQARGEEAGPQADIYSLGVVAYQLLSGRLPYEANSLSELTLKQQREAPAALDRLNPSVPRELAQAVALALALEPERRPADAIAFGEGLRKGAHGIEPPMATASTAALGTGATRVISGRDDTAATRMATRARPAPAAAGTPARPVRRLEPRPYATDPYQRVPAHLRRGAPAPGPGRPPRPARIVCRPPVRRRGGHRAGSLHQHLADGVEHPHDDLSRRQQRDQLALQPDQPVHEIDAPGAAPALRAAVTSGRRPAAIPARSSSISRAMKVRLWSVTRRSAVSSPARSR